MIDGADLDDPLVADRLHRSIDCLPEKEREPLIAADWELWKERREVETSETVLRTTY